MASYLEIASREKLDLYQEQLDKNSSADALLSNKLKEGRRGDFKQQVQSQPAQVLLKKGYQVTFKPPVRVGRMFSTPGTGKVVKEKYKDTGRATIINYTGSTTTLSPALEWSTEGYIEKKGPKSVSNKRYVRGGDPLYINLTPKGILANKMNEQFKGAKNTKPLNYPEVK